MNSVKKLKKVAKIMYTCLMKMLTYLRINDEKGLVSLTNIAMIVMLWKVGSTDATSITDLTALFIAILGYQTKRVIQKK